MSSDKQEKYVRKVTWMGKRSLSVVILTEIVEVMDMRERKKMSIYRNGNTIVVADYT